MPLYAYTVISETGVVINGESAAASIQALSAELSGRGYLVRYIKPKWTLFSLGKQQRIKPEAFSLFNKEFMALIRAGLTVPDALLITSKRPDAPVLEKILQCVREDVNNGLTLSEACARHPEIFDGLYISALYTGEKTGDLVNVLARYQEYLKHRIALRKKISQALAYPMFLLIALAVILVVLFVFVMPRFVAMYADFGAELPFSTSVLLGIVDHLYVIGPLLILITLVCGWSWRHWTSTESGRLQVDAFKERLPYVSEVQLMVSVAQLARALSMLLGGGTPLVEAMKTARNSLTNRAYASRLDHARQHVTAGERLAKAMRENQLVPDIAVRMIEVGEATGSLEGMLREVAQFYEEILDTRLERVMALIEPLLMLLMGLLIGSIIIVMYLPVFHMADIIK